MTVGIETSKPESYQRVLRVTERKKKITKQKNEDNILLKFTRQKVE